MKILFFLAHPSSIGGAMKVLLTQAYIMQLRSHEVRVVIQDDNANTHIPEYDELCRNFGIDYLSAQYPIATCIEEIDILDCMDKYDQIYEMITDYNPDIIHSVQLNITVELVARQLKIPHLMNIYPISDGMFNIDWIDVFPQYHSCDSNFYCEKWQHGIGVKTKCIRVAYEKKGLVTHNYVGNNCRYELINIASFSEFKQQLEIIKFVELCKSKGLRLHISFVGYNTNNYGDICKEYVEEHWLNEEVSFVGQVVNVEEYLLRAELMIHASTAESYPGVIVEAMANKVPVIVTPVAGIPELVQDEVNGFLLKGYTYTEIYTCFEKYQIYKESGKIFELIDNAYHTYLTHHTYDIAGKELDEYYNEIINDSKNCVEESLHKEKLQVLFSKFCDNFSNIQISNITKNKLWFLYHIKRTIDKNAYSSVLIWGAGNFGKIALEWCGLLKLQILGYIDSSKTGEYLTYKIYNMDSEVMEQADIILVAVSNMTASQEIMTYLESHNRVRNVNYFLMCNNPCLNNVCLKP